MRLAITYACVLVGGMLLGRWASTWDWHPDKLVVPRGLDALLTGIVFAVGPVWASIERKTRKP